jgi:hypothetical protein
MDQEEMLKELGVSRKELYELLTRFGAFFESLDKRQQAVIRRSFPTLTEAAKTFGPDVTGDDLRKLFEGVSAIPPIIICYFAFRRSS